MSYLRILALPVLFASSFVANAGDSQATLSHCAKAALGERVSEQTIVSFDEKLSHVSVARKSFSMANQLVSIDLADSKGNPLGVAKCAYSPQGRIISATLTPQVLEVAGI